MELLESNKGYKIPSRVKLVSGVWKYQKYDEKQAFVVDADSDSQLKTAIDWAGGKYDKDNEEKIKSEIIETDNEGFEIEFLENAGYSSQGGKLSFWDCKVTKDNETFIIGINQDLLLELIKSATIVKGKVQEKCLFVKQRGNTGLIIKDSGIYKECMKEIELKKNLQSLKKTTAWEKGYFYNTVSNNSDVYICDVYVWYKEEKLGWYKSLIHKLDKPIKMKVMLSDYYFREDSSLLNYINGKNYFFEYISGNLKKSLPSRFKTDKKPVDIDVTNEELEKLKLQYLEETFNKQIDNRSNKILTASLIKTSLITFTQDPPILINELKNDSKFETY